MKLGNFLLGYVMTDEEILLLIEDGKMINIDTKKSRLVIPRKSGGIYQRSLENTNIVEIIKAKSYEKCEGYEVFYEYR